MSIAMDVVRSMRAVILLAGRVGPSPLADGTGRSVLDLPVDASRSLLDHWMERLDEFAETMQLPELLVRVAVDQRGEAPHVRPVRERGRVRCEVVRDPGEFRGTAGIVRDLTREYAPEDRILVATANQIQLEPIAELVDALAEAGEGVSLVPHAGSELAGMFLLRASRLGAVPDVGFVDLKEQAIPSDRRHEALAVTRRAVGSALAVRTLPEYIDALRVVHDAQGSRSAAASLSDPFAEHWRPVFSIVEEGADADPARCVLQDSVVLRGARVEAGAAVARSVVCDGAVVRRGETPFEEIVTA